MTTQIPSQQVSRAPIAQRILTVGFRGCLTLTIMLVAIYVFHAVYVLGLNHIYQLRWQKYGSRNYRAVVTLGGIFPLSGTNTITVEDGKVAAAVSHTPHDLYYFDELTIENTFATVRSCAKYFPYVFCTLEYDEHYGYPKHVVIGCFFPDCWREVTMDEIELLSL